MRVAVLCNDRLGIPALQQLVQSRLVAAVGTSDRSPEMIALMKQVTAQAGVPSMIFEEKNLEDNLSSWLLQHKPDVVLVKTFPYRIPAALLDVPTHGFINFHYAPLPGYRGSNPLFWMIKEQVAMGGVSIHKMDKNFDSGPVLFKMEVPIQPGASFGLCSTQLAYAGLQLTGPLLQALSSGNTKPVAQEQTSKRWYGRPEANDATVHWNKMNASQVQALACACNPWLKGAVTQIKGWTIGITSATPCDVPVTEGTLPGTILRISKEQGLVVACHEQAAVVVDVVYTEEGYFAGHQLSKFNIQINDRFDS
jgi:methionyl-tRNA formyltransferase